MHFKEYPISILCSGLVKDRYHEAPTPVANVTFT